MPQGVLEGLRQLALDLHELPSRGAQLRLPLLQGLLREKPGVPRGLDLSAERVASGLGPLHLRLQ